MNTEDIMAMARQAGYNPAQFTSPSTIERIAQAAAMAELEACCTLLEGMHEAATSSHNYYLYAAKCLRDLRGKA